MPRPNPPRLTKDTDRHGNIRWYVRTLDGPKVRLRDEYGTPAFWQAYRDVLAGNIKPPPPSTRIERKPFDKASLAWLCSQYYTSAEYKQLNERTRYVRRATLDHICAADGEKPYKLLLPKHIRARRDARADRPESANGMIKALRQVFAFAIENDYVALNPAQAVPYLKAKGDGHHSWSLEEIEKFEKKHPIGTMARLALALLLYTGQRRSDVIVLGPALVREGWLHFTQFKGREHKPITLDIPIIPELQRVIDATACGKDTYLLNGLGRPFTAAGFGNWFHDRCKDAKVPGRAHGLRKAAASRLAELGSSEHEIMAITGHTTSKEVMRYTKAARQKVLAAAAMARLKPKSEIAVTFPPETDPKSGGKKVPPKSLKNMEVTNLMVPGAEPH
ncbi:phage integrase [Nitrobacter hamburgensis X14]|uniref:Phage integrase n=1 Tax=Nitrobacter hamburgensis (strain DSM 10229 / NCIMB 13809 / X14) TaxID=323097 RepID=Q1QRC6_NITHX|nr:tyrosine-type recombinase/integrase [Nitrobacter hamburgensis]ABE61221.1 phage integrase [Nitrobacter hamburgensis X14]